MASSKVTCVPKDKEQETFSPVVLGLLQVSSSEKKGGFSNYLRDFPMCQLALKGLRDFCVRWGRGRWGEFLDMSTPYLYLSLLFLQ